MIHLRLQEKCARAVDTDSRKLFGFPYYLTFDHLVLLASTRWSCVLFVLIELK